MRRLLALALAVAATPALAAQPTMTNGDFLRRAEPMMKKSMASLMFSKDARALGRALGEAASAVRARQEADVAAGRKPATCVPPKGQAKIDAMGLVQYLKTLPPAEQAKPFQTGMSGYLARKYPCRA